MHTITNIFLHMQGWRREAAFCILPCLLLAGLLGLSGCSSKIPIRPGTPVEQSGVVLDLKRFPQDMLVYAQKNNPDSPLLSLETQAQEDARFNSIFFSPWDKTKSSYTPRKFRRLFGKAWGYTGAAPWTKEEWDAIVHNARGKAFPSRLSSAIIVRDTPLREMPTMRPRYGRSTPNPSIDPFDYIQYSLLPLGTPVYISHISRDKQWFFVENPVAAGWIHAADAAMADEEFRNTYRNGRYAAIIKDHSPLLTGDGQSLGEAQIGTILPVVGPVANGLSVLVPTRNASGHAVVRQAVIPAMHAAIKPLPLTPRALAEVGNGMLGQPYGWGGTNGERDCSSTTRDLFAPFGLWLPRNSAAQARSGQLTMVDFADFKEKERMLLAQGTPFLTLVWFKGHVGLYLGKYRNKAAMYHNIWGVRVTEGGNGLERHVIGRCVITGLAPGQELRHADKERPLISRMQGFTLLPKGAQ